MSRLLASFLTIGVLLAVAPGSGQARAEVDRAFFLDGSHKLPFESDRAGAVLARAGRIFVLGDGDQIVAVTTGGHVDRGYGIRGGARAAVNDTLGTPPTLLADPRPADPRGLIAAGAQGFTELVQVRLDGRGRLDPRWGSGGTQRLFNHDGYVHAAQNAIADPLHPGRVIVGATVAPPYCGPGAPGCATRLQIARLDARGQPDPAWGDGGVTRIDLPPAGPAELALANGPDGSVTALLTASVGPFGTEHRVAVVRLTSAGQPLPGAPGAGPLHVLPTVSGDHVFTDAGAGFFVGNRFGPPTSLTHVLADGTADPDFTAVRVPRLSEVTAAHDTRDGVVVVGTVRHGTANLPRLVRLGRGGVPDPRFGPGGVLTLGFRQVRIAQILSTVTEDELGRLVLAGSVGDLWTDIREDLSATTLGLMRVRTRAPDLDLASRRVTVDGRGVARVRVRCGPRVTDGCTGARFDVRRARHVLGRAQVPALAAGRTRVIEVRVGHAGRRLAGRHAAVDVALTLMPRRLPVQSVPIESVLRSARLLTG
ncbi:MAG: enzyme repeat protein [Solirubrobacterales bacterium]|nr:enzyme repeat protein [Solirubrobacterales bacterium]